jgi:hypothetical protein
LEAKKDALNSPVKVHSVNVLPYKRQITSIAVLEIWSENKDDFTVNLRYKFTCYSSFCVLKTPDAGSNDLRPFLLGGSRVYP